MPSRTSPPLPRCEGGRVTGVACRWARATHVRCDSASASMRTGGSLKRARARAIRWEAGKGEVRGGRGGKNISPQPQTTWRPPTCCRAGLPVTALSSTRVA
jgi:hypothetical protein